jgi:hypothetical protein
MADGRTERVTFRLSKEEMSMLVEIAACDADPDDVGDANLARAMRLMIRSTYAAKKGTPKKKRRHFPKLVSGAR